MLFVDPDREIRDDVKNTIRTRVCHKCKGRLSIKNQQYFYSNFSQSRFHLELDCVRCNTLYVLEDDRLIRVQDSHQIWNWPFF